MSIAPRPHLFAAALDSLMQERGVNQVGLAALTGIAISRLYSYLRGNYRTVEPGRLAAMMKALGDKLAETSVLVQAYLFDLAEDRCREWIEIQVAGPKETKHWVKLTKDQPKGFAGELEDLYRLCVDCPRERQRTAE